jgi:hypothetical protein
VHVLLQVRNFMRHILEVSLEPTQVAAGDMRVYELHLRGTAFLWHQVSAPPVQMYGCTVAHSGCEGPCLAPFPQELWCRSIVLGAVVHCRSQAGSKHFCMATPCPPSARIDEGVAVTTSKPQQGVEVCCAQRLWCRCAALWPSC